MTAGEDLSVDLPGPDEAELRRCIEALVLVSDTPAPTELLSQLVEVAPARVEAACRALAAEYEAQGRGFRLARVAGGWRFESHPDLAGYVERFVLEGVSARLSAAALETLAIVAYKQPISRAQVNAIRGVDADGVLRTLTQRGLVEAVGRDPGPGQALLYGTTPAFLERLGLDRIEDLPPLGEFVPGPEIVEALEAGLRVEPASPPAADSPPAPEPASSHPGDPPEAHGPEPGPSPAAGAAEASPPAPDAPGASPAEPPA